MAEPSTAAEPDAPASAAGASTAEEANAEAPVAAEPAAGEPMEDDSAGAMEEDSFGDDMFALEPIDPDLPNKIRKWNAECYSCHSEEGLKNPPRDDMDMAELAELLMTSPGFDAGVHKGMACKECHAEGYVEFPHGEPGQREIKPCLECHPLRGGEIEKEFKESVHYKEHGDKFTCISCHEAHYMQVAEQIRVPRAIARQDNGFCLRCHESETLYSEFVETKELPDLDRVHEWLPNPPLHWDALRCVDCHTPEVAVSISHQVMPKDKAEQECVSCHSRDSSLRTRLYRYLAQEDRMGKVGFVNGVLLTDAYVVGATRNEWLDRASFLIVAFVVGGILVHGALRMLSGAIRRRKHRV